MKKIITLLLLTVITLIMSACSSSSSTAEGDDSPIVMASIIASDVVDSGNDLNISIVVTDADGVDSVRYNVYAQSDVSHADYLLAGVLSDSVVDGNYTALINSSSLVDGNYTTVVDGVGYVGGVNEDSEDSVEHTFSIVTNNAPTGESFTVDAGNTATFTVDLTSNINDADGDSMTVTYVGSGVSSGDIVIDNANTGITGTDAKITVTTGTGQGYIDYSVTDGTDTSVTYRITFIQLNGISIATNNVPTGESFTVDAGNTATFTVDLTSHINDADGDTMTVTYVGSGVSSGDIVIDNANTGITGTNAKITVSDGTGNGYIDYTVTDGTDTSRTYRITFNSLDGI